MATRKINNRWHVDFRFDGRRIRKVAPENTKGSAKEYEEELMNELKEQRRFKKGFLSRKYASYEQFSKDWFETYVQANNRPAEVKKKESLLRNHIVPFFGKMAVDEIYEQELERFKVQKKEEGYSPKTINNMLSVVHKSLDSAAEWRVIRRVPRVKWMKVPKKHIEVYSKHVQELFLYDRSDLLWNTMIVAALKTGMRIGELLALRWSDIDLELGTLSVNGSMNVKYERAPTKNGKSRSLPLNYQLNQMLKDMYDPSYELDAFVFDRGDGRPHSVYAATDALKKIAKRLGIRERVHWHKFRHTFATNIARSGVTSMRVLQEMMGHSSITMTERYSHVDMTSMKEAITALDYKFEDFGQKVGRFQYLSLPQNPLQGQNMALLQQKKTINDDL